MSELVGIWRDDERLGRGIAAVGVFNERVKNVKAEGSSQYNPAWHEALDLPNMLVIAEAVATAAKLRQESRGAHSRVDYEGERDEWGEYNIAVRMAGDGSMAFEKLERSAPPNELMAIAKAEGDDLINMEGPLD